MDKLTRACYDTLHDFPGGAPAMAKRLAENPGTLSNRVDPTQERHRLPIELALAMMLTSGDYRILHAMAQECGFACYHLGDWSDCSDMELLDRITELGSKRGDVDRSIHDALKDGVVERREYEAIHARVHDAIRANLELLTRLEALAVAEANRTVTKIKAA